ncbi:MAG: hypothetical protein QXT48_02055, partial [Thermoplasmatales archaeon]
MVLIKMNSRIKIVLVVLVMIASVVLVTSPSFAQASGTVTYSPVIFSAGTTVLAEALKCFLYFFKYYMRIIVFNEICIISRRNVTFVHS